MRLVVRALAARGPLVWARWAPAEQEVPPRIPFVMFRSQNWEDAQLQALRDRVAAFSGALRWECRTRGRNSMIAPLAALEALEGTPSVRDSQLLAELADHAPELAAKAQLDVGPLASWLDSRKPES